MRIDKPPRRYLFALVVASFSLAESGSGSVQIKPTPDQSTSIPKDAARSLVGRVFQWQVTYPESGPPIEPETPADYRLHFATIDRVTLNADCNQYAAPVRLTDSVFSVGRMMGTRALCSRDSLEDVFIEGIMASSGWRLDADELILTQPHDSGAMHFKEITEQLK